MRNIQNFCKTFRTDVLDLTLNQVQNMTGVSLKTLSAFENGNSSNLNHLIIYYGLCSSSKHELLFIEGFKIALDLDRHILIYV